MTQAEINILIRSSAKQAREQFLAVKRDLDRIAKSGANAGGVLDGLAKASAGFSSGMSGAAKAAQTLATSLQSINKSAPATVKHINGIGTAAERSTIHVRSLAGANELLTVSMANVTRTTATATSGLTAYAAAAKAAAAAAAASRGGGGKKPPAGPTPAASAAAGGVGGALARQAREMDTYSSAAGRATGNTRTLGRELATVGQAARGSGQGFSSAAGSARTFTESTRIYTNAAQAGTQATRGMSGAVGGMREQLQLTTKAHTANAAQMAASGAAGSAALNKLTGHVGPARTRFMRFNDSLYQTSDALRKAGSQMQWTGRQMSAVFTMPAALGVGFGVKWAMDQERAFTRMAKVYDGAIEDIDQNLMEPGIQFQGSGYDRFFRALSDTMGVSKAEVAQIGSDWAQTGLQGVELAKATKLTTEFMILGDQGAAKSTQDLISVKNQYKLTTDELKDAVMALNAVENNTAANMADLTEAFTKSASVAREAGVSYVELAAFTAALVPATGSAATAGNGLKAVFTRLMTPTKQAAEKMAEMGIEVGGIISPTDGAAEALARYGKEVRTTEWQSMTATERMIALSASYKELTQQQKFDLSKPLAGLFQINRAMEVWADLGADVSTFETALAAAGNETERFRIYQQELDRVLESSPQKMKQMGVMMQNSLVDIIQPLIPHILALMKSIVGMMRAFADMDPKWQKFIVYAVLALAALGPLAMIFGTFTILGGVVGKAFFRMGQMASFFAWHLFKIGPGLKILNGDVVARTRVWPKLWGGMMTAMRAVSAAGMAAIQGIMTLAHKMGLVSTSTYESARIKMEERANRIRVAQAQRAAAQMAAAGAGGATAGAGGAAAGAAAAGAAAGGMSSGSAAAAGAAGASTVRALGAGASTAARAESGRFAALMAAMFLTPWGKMVRGIGNLMRPLKDAFSSFRMHFRNGAQGVKTLSIESGKQIGRIPAALGQASVGVGKIVSRMWRPFASLGSKILGAFARIGPGILKFVTTWGGPIAWVVGGITSAIIAMPGKVLGVFGAFGNKIRDAWNKMFGGGGGVPMLARPFVFAVDVIAETLRMLPRLVVAIFQTVVAVIQKAAKKVYDAFSYINPFARHSPSLVENVTAGMAIVAQQFRTASVSVQRDAMAAYAAIARFGDATAGLSLRGAEVERAEKREKISTVAPEVLPAYDDLEAQLPRLNAHLREVNEELARQQLVMDKLDAQVKSADRHLSELGKTLDELNKAATAAGDALAKAQERLDMYSSAPIIGMRAMSDAIFANEMAQKKLRLEIMRMEDAGGVVDDLADRFSKLQGEIENLSGERESLRQSGAGSDILSVYDRMISDLEAQQGAAAMDRLAPIDEANKELERLSREAERLDLENALKFDPLTRQIEQMTNATRELSFGEITAGIRSSQAEVTALTAAFDEANAAVASHELVIESAQAARDLLGETYDREQDKLRDLETVQRGLEQAISDVESAMSDIISTVDTLTAALEKSERAAKDAKDALDELSDWDAAGMADFDSAAGGLGEVDMSSMDDLTAELEKKIDGMFGSLNIMGWIGDIFKSIGSAFASLWGDHIWPFLKEIPGHIGQFFMDLPASLSYFLGYAIGTLAKLALSAILGIWDLAGWFGGLIESAGEAILKFAKEKLFTKKFWTDLWNNAYANITGIDWAQLGLNIWNGVLSGITTALKAVGTWLNDNIFQPFWNGIKDAFGIASPSKKMMEIGTWIIEGLFSGILSLVTGIATWLWDNVAWPVISFFADSATWLWDHGIGLITGMFDGILNWMSSIGSWLDGNVLQPVLTFFKDAPTWLWDHGIDLITGMFNGILNWMSGLTSWLDEHVLQPVLNFFTGAPRWLWDSGVDLVTGMFNGAKGWLTGLPGWLNENIWQPILDFVTGLPSKIAEKASGMWGGITDAFKTAGNTLIDLWNWLAKKLTFQVPELHIKGTNIDIGGGEIKLLPEFDHLAKGGVAGLSAAGALFGPGTGTSDSILGIDEATGIPTAMVSAGEGVVRHSAMQRGGAQLVAAMNAGWRPAMDLLRTLPRHAAGTPIATGSMPAPAAQADAPSVGGVDLAGASEQIAALSAALDALMIKMDEVVVEVGVFSLDTNAAFDALYGGIAADTATFTANYQSQMSSMRSSETALTLEFSASTQATFTALSVSVLATMTTMSSDVTATIAAMLAALSGSFKSGYGDITAQTVGFVDGTTALWSGMATGLQDTFTGEIKPMFDSFKPMLDQTESWFSDSVSNIGAIWAGIKEPVAQPSRFVINDVYNDGIRGAWNQFNSFLDLPELPEHVARFATGGPVYGAGTATSDSIPALLSNQEHVVTAAEVRGAGGHRAVQETRKLWAAGHAPAFAKGGPVMQDAPPWAGGGGEANLQPAAILARRNIKMYWPQIQSIGGYRAQDAYPDHPSGLALDIMTGDPMGTEINEWLHAQKDALALNYTIWKQFYRPAGGGGNRMEDRGSITQNHYDHVHALFNASGVAGIEFGGVGSSGAPVVPMDQIVRDAINKKMDAIAEIAPSFGGGIGQWIPKSIEKGRDGLLEKLVPMAAAMTQAMSAAGSSGNAESWRPMAIEAMIRNGFDANNKAQVDAMIRQIHSESGGNPRAIQNGFVDVNTGGNEAVGLLQIAKGTWPEVRDPSLVDDRMDPWANMNGALRYYKKNYGMDLTTNWGRGMGYDQGGMLPPTPGGFGTFFNHTGKPEAVLTAPEWTAIKSIAAAATAFDYETIAEGMVFASKKIYGPNPSQAQAEEFADSMMTEVEPWRREQLVAANSQAQSADIMANASMAISSGLKSLAEASTDIGSAISLTAQIAIDAMAAMENFNAGTSGFADMVPILNGISSLLGLIPDQTPTYTPWAGQGVAMTDKMKQEQAWTDAGNIGKGILQLTKDIGPKILTHTVTIGSALTQLATDNAPIIAAAIAMAPVNPVGSAIMLIPVILQGLVTLVPAIIAAIMDIVPALMAGIVRFFTSFGPGASYSYDTMAEAEAAMAGNMEALRQGAVAPTFIIPAGANGGSSETVTLNIYGDLSMPNVTNGADAAGLVSNLKTLAGGS